ncbi:MAG: hypothetical protein HN877_17900 [Rhodospirillaceae bacterium]|nr:hypothetical protein [Rhodospirillaceae bacterium]
MRSPFSEFITWPLTQLIGQALVGRVDAPQGATTAAPFQAQRKSTLYKSGITLRAKPPIRKRPEVIAIGSSTGGPQALLEVVKKIKSDVRQPIVNTQHMPATFTTILAQHLGTASGRQASEGRDGEPLSPGHIYLAPGDYHMTIEGRGSAKVIRLNQNPPESYCRPAVDPMFRSLAACYGDRILGVILTGMGSDGCKGADEIVKVGGTVIAQDEQSSVVWGMPGAVATAGLCEAVIPLDQVSNYINDFVAKGMP